MARTLLVALLALTTAAVAQPAPAPAPAAPPPGTPSVPDSPEPKQQPTTMAAPATPAPAPEGADVNQQIENAKKEMREEIRAQLATQSAAQGWEEEWVEQAQKLELLELDGYLRIRPDLFHKFDLGRLEDPDGYTLFPKPPTSERERTIAGVNMRMRVEPTINVSEEVRIKMQVDALDNVVFGSNPIYANTRSDRYEFGVFNETQMPPTSGVNAVRDAIAIKRAYGEVSTPVGILRFGRMGSHWGLGMLHNDGNCIDCDFGNTVDRIQFVSEPFTGWYIAPMVDFDVEGPTSAMAGDQGQPYDVSNTDDAHSYIIAIARRDTEQQEKAKLENNLGVLNYGIHFSYRLQQYDATGWAGGDVGEGFVLRDARLYIPDVWAKYERKDWRVEIEAAAVLGTIGNRALTAASASDPGQNQALNLTQFGVVAQGEYRFLDGQLRLQVDAGYASGDIAPGMGNYPRRKTGGANGNTLSAADSPKGGSIDGRQYNCSTNGSCPDDYIRNFRFNRDYRVDMILWRELLGGVTDAIYVKPNLTYSVAEGFDIYGGVIGSSAVYKESTPSQTDSLLGIEINAGARYETEDGFFAQMQWGILFPQGGFANVGGASAPETETAQALRAIIGIKY